MMLRNGRMLNLVHAKAKLESLTVQVFEPACILRHQQQLRPLGVWKMGVKKRDITSTWEHKSLVLINLGGIQLQGWGKADLLRAGEKLICNHGYLQYIMFFLSNIFKSNKQMNFPVSLQNI